MPDNIAQRRSKSYRLPVEDTEFLLHNAMRVVRFALEYAKAELWPRDRPCDRRSLYSAAPSPEQAEILLENGGGNRGIEAGKALRPAMPERPASGSTSACRPSRSPTPIRCSRGSPSTTRFARSLPQRGGCHKPSFTSTHPD